MTPPVHRPLSCPACGLGVSGLENACPRCGTKFDKSLKTECPFCGELIFKGSIRCPMCQMAIGGLRDKAKALEQEKSVDTLLDEISSRLSAQLTSKPATKEPEVRLEEIEKSLTCPVCKAFVSLDTRVCPKCGSNLPQRAPVPAKPPLVPAAPPPPSAEEALATLGEIAKRVSKPSRSRKVRAGKVTTVDTTARAGGHGLSNGVGQVNGTSMVNGRSRTNGTGRINGRTNGRTNGKGAVNGKSLVNGTGISNGLRARDRGAGGRQNFLLTKWQFLVVLIAIVVVIPTFFFVSYSRKGEPFKVDGDFGEWSDRAKFGAMIQASSPSINITEWSVATSSMSLYLYVKTQDNIMQSSEAESFYLFIDSDGSPSTGYLVGSLGAEYMAQLNGWNGSVQSSWLSERSSSTDNYDWNSWVQIDSLTTYVNGNGLEAKAEMPVALGDSAEFLLMSKDSSEASSVSYSVPAEGSVLIVDQEPAAGVADDGIVPANNPTPLLTLKLKCEGAGGRVDQITPVIVGALPSTPVASFSLDEGKERTVQIYVDTSSAAPGDLVSAHVTESGIVSSFTRIEVLGEGASAYVGASPPAIEIDGAFADWAGRLSMDQDAFPVSNPNLDVDEVGNVNTSGSSYFYVSVEGEICSGTYVPAIFAKPSGTGGGGIVLPSRKTAEDILRIYVDSDKSASTGYPVTLDSKLIGADRMVEVKGLHGIITSSSLWAYLSNNWTQSSASIEAAKDSKRIELGVSRLDLGTSSDIDFIIETTDWNGRGDKAAYDQSSLRAITASLSPGIGIDRWVVDGTTTSVGATATSNQRKVFYDGTNYWSFFFDGTNTIYKYSDDDGVTWTSRGAVFKTSGVNKTSIWYDSATSTVYAVGDRSTASLNVSLQKGTVNPAPRTISWAASDSLLATSSYDLGGKNTFISKDANGYLWVLSSNYSKTTPNKYDLTAFHSSASDSITSWVFSGTIVSKDSNDNIKGSIVPAGTGSDMWAIYTYSGNMASMKYTGTWQNPQTTLPVGGGGGSTENTDNSPPSVVVDSHRVVHVVYGTNRKVGSLSMPTIYYSHNNTGSTAFANPKDLDPAIPADVGDIYPTISLDSSTGNFYVFWLRTDTSAAGKTLMGAKNATGTWSNLTFGSQTSYTKQYLTSIYSVAGEARICWQWTQNTTAPIQVLFDNNIPEFPSAVVPVMFVLALVAVYRQRTRRKEE